MYCWKLFGIEKRKRMRIRKYRNPKLENCNNFVLLKNKMAKEK